MALTLQNILDFVIENTQVDLDSSVVLDLSHITPKVNWALRVLSKRIRQIEPSVGFTLLTDTPLYNLRGTAFTQRCTMVHSVTINGNTLLTADARGYGMWALMELERLAPGYRTDPSNVPTKAVQYGTKLLIHPAPTLAVVNAGGNFVKAEVLAPDLAAGSDVPDIPEEMHEALAQLVVVKVTTPMVTEDEGWKRLQAIDGDIGGIVEEIRGENVRLIDDFGTTLQGDHYPDWMWI